MASKTKWLKVRRKLRGANAGKKRKNAYKNGHFSVEFLVLNKPNAAEKAAAKASNSSK